MENKKVVRRSSPVVYKSKPTYEFFKRVFDIVMSSLGLVILSPVFLVVAILVKLDGGPVFFKQTRVGKGGKTFTFYKFRSMIVGADSPELLQKLASLNEVDGPAFKIKDDPRITKIGKFIRKASIDELPQLYNILKNDMTIVGPRPALVNEVECYDEYQSQRLLVKQGLTCFWQCSGRSNISFDEWIELDLDYIEQRSFFTDIKIILKTVPAVLTGKGAS